MKLLSVIAATCLYQNVVADHNPNKGVAEQESDDTKYTEEQEECLFNPDTDLECENSSRGFDTKVNPWYTYWNPYKKHYLIPMHVQTGSYSSSMLPTLWESLNWAKKTFADHTNIELVFIDDYEASNVYRDGYIKPFYGGACWSYLGNHRSSQQMDIGWCYNVPGSIVHETMHALGFVHEHMRPDRDQYVNVSSRNSANCKKYLEGRLDTSGTKYDYASIMHYPEGACGIQVRDPSKRRVVGNRQRLSPLDIKEINEIYPETGPKF